jgi:nucleotide-binding universal stress UspA family protein
MKKITKPAKTDLNDPHIKKILIALNDNTTAQNVAETGYFFSVVMNAEVILLHVIAPQETLPEYSPVIGHLALDTSSIKKLSSNDGLKMATRYFLEKSKLRLGDGNIQTIVAEGDSVDEILRAAERLNVDLIVIEAHNSNWFDKILFRSAIKRVLNHTSIPLYIVPVKRTN